MPRLISVIIAPSKHQAIAVFDIVAHGVAADRAFIDADIGGMRFREDGFAHDGRRNRNAGARDDLGERSLQRKAMQLFARENDRVFCRRYPFLGFGDGRRQRFGIAHFSGQSARVDGPISTSVMSRGSSI